MFFFSITMRLTFVFKLNNITRTYTKKSHLMIYTYWRCRCVCTEHVNRYTRCFLFFRVQSWFLGVKTTFISRGDCLPKLMFSNILSKASGSFFFRNVRIFQRCFIIIIIHPYTLYYMFVWILPLLFPCTSLWRG